MDLMCCPHICYISPLITHHSPLFLPDTVGHEAQVHSPQPTPLKWCGAQRHDSRYRTFYDLCHCNLRNAGNTLLTNNTDKDAEGVCAYLARVLTHNWSLEAGSASCLDVCQMIVCALLYCKQWMRGRQGRGVHDQSYEETGHMMMRQRRKIKGFLWLVQCKIQLPHRV